MFSFLFSFFYKFPPLGLQVSCQVSETENFFSFLLSFCCKESLCLFKKNDLYCNYFFLSNFNFSKKKVGIPNVRHCHDIKKESSRFHCQLLACPMPCTHSREIGCHPFFRKSGILMVFFTRSSYRR